MSFNKTFITDEKTILDYTFKDLKPLFDLIPEIKNTKDFNESPLIDEFQKLAYETRIMINFDWDEWPEGNEIILNPDFNYSSLDIIEVCKLITAVIKSESFIDNGLIDYFEEGIILELLETLENKISF